MPNPYLTSTTPQGNTPLLPREDRRPILFVLLALVISRMFATWSGIIMDDAPLRGFFQYIDISLMQADLLRSIWYLHSQPPLVNLCLGVLVKLFGEDGASTAVVVIFHALTPFFAMSCYGIARECGLGRLVASVVTSIVVTSPAAIMYENFLFYTWPVAVFLTAGMWALGRYVRSGSTAGACAFAAFGTVVMMRSSYHPVWLLALAVVALLALRREHDGAVRRRNLAIVGIPLLVCCGWYGKNLIQVGEFSGSTWLGMSLSKMATTKLPPEQLKAMVARGEADPILLIDSFTPLEFYNVTSHAPKDAPAIVRLPTKLGGEPNFNALEFVEVSRSYRHAAVRLIRERPDLYRESLKLALIIYAKPSSEYVFLREFNLRLRLYERIYGILFQGKFGEHTFVKGPDVLMTTRRAHELRNIGFLIPVMITIGLAFAARILFRIVRRLEVGPPDYLMLAMAGTVAWNLATGTLLEVGENNRFRFEVEALHTILAVAVVARVWEWWRRAM